MITLISQTEFGAEFSNGDTLGSHTTTGNLAVVCLGNTTVSYTDVTAITYGGQAMTRAIGLDRTEPPVVSNAQTRSDIWYLFNPPTGTQNVVITRGAGAIAFAGSISSYSEVLSLQGTTSLQGKDENILNVTTTSRGALIVACFTTSSNLIAPYVVGGPTVLSHNDGTNPRVGTSYQITTTAGAYESTWIDSTGNSDTVLLSATFNANPSNSNFFPFFYQT